MGAKDKEAPASPSCGCCVIELYNTKHQHSAIRFVTADAQHRGEDKVLLANRHAVYQAARENRPARRSCRTRNWHPVGPVWLNPERPDTRRRGHGGADAPPTKLAAAHP